MCGRLGVSGRLVVPGTTMQFSIGKSKRIGVWGTPFRASNVIGEGYNYNARSENLHLPFWKNFPKRGVVYADYFIENKVCAFGYKSREPVGMGIIYNDNDEFMIVTQNACESVQHIHSRMPVIVTNYNANLWLEAAMIMPPTDIIMVAKVTYKAIF